ncbi:MAG: hypothetical protein ACPL7K_03485 [Armatimonadota bacterium]
MVRTVYKFTFDDNVAMDEVERILALSVIPVESIHGESAMLVDGRFAVNKRRRTCLIDAESQLGNDLARVFTGFLNANSGGGFRVDIRETGEQLGDVLDLYGAFA